MTVSTIHAACAAGPRCHAWDSVTRRPAAVDRSPLCDADIENAERDIRALVLDYRDLEHFLPPALGVWSDGMPRAASEHRIPIRLDVVALQAEICHVLHVWEVAVREADRLSAMRPGGVRPGRAVQNSVLIVAPRVRVLAGLGATETWDYPGSHGYSLKLGWQGILDLSALHARARHALLLTPVRPELIDGVPCKGCDLRSALYREPGYDTVRCGGCGWRYTADEYKQWCGLVAASVKEAA